MKSKILFVTLLGLALALSACGPAASTPAPTAAPAATDTAIVPVTGASTDTAVPPAATMAPTAAVTGGTAVMVVQNATLGSFLVDSKGMTERNPPQALSFQRQGTRRISQMFQQNFSGQDL